MDQAQLAECLGMLLCIPHSIRASDTVVFDPGLDPGRYRSNTGGEFEERVFGTLDSQMPDKDRFRDAAAFTVTCTHCEGSVEFEPIYDREVSLFGHLAVLFPSLFMG